VVSIHVTVKKSSKANFPLDPLLASSVLSGKTRVAGAEQLVHLFECTSLSFGNTEVHPDDTDGRDGAEENLAEGQSVRDFIFERGGVLLTNAPN
jgi:hypothetical protein